jgi:hypothetical protein
MMHGTLDRLVGFENMKLAHNIFREQSEALATSRAAPGVKLTSRAFKVAEKYLSGQGTLIPGAFQHGDESFLSSTAFVPGDFIAEAATGTAIADSKEEALAQKLAKQLFDIDAESESQLSVARNFVLSGNMSRLGHALQTDKVGVADLDVAGKSMGPREIFAAWREQNCNVQDLD